MRYDQIDPTMRRFIGAWEGFRKLGYRADDLFCLVARSVDAGGRLACFVALRAQGLEFNMEAGQIGHYTEESWAKYYTEVADALAAGQIPQACMDRMWQESECHKNPVIFVLSLKNKGFTIPKETN